MASRPFTVGAAPVRRRSEPALHFAVHAAGILAFVAIINPLQPGTSALWLLPIAAVWLVAARVGFARHATDLNALGLPTAALRGTVVGLVALTAVAFWPSGAHLDKPKLLLTAAVVWLVLIVTETLYARRAALRPRVLILGAGVTARDLLHVMQTPGTRYEVIGVLADESGDHNGDNVPVGTLDSLPEALTVGRPDIVVLAVDRGRPRVFAPLLDAAEEGYRVVEAAQFFEYAFGRVPVRDLTRAWFMSVLHLYQRPYSRLTKRLFDVVLATIGLLAVLPFLPFVVIAVKASRGPLLFRQERVGEHGRTFTILKFRTMRTNAEEPGQAVWATKGDPRVTRTGRFLRATRIDEIPQLWNVLRGDMSIVGPRPERPEFMEFLEQKVPFWSRRHLIKPGVTGWAQVRRGYTSDAAGSLDKLSYDLWYLRHRSLLVDVAICIKTIGVLLNGRATSEGGERAEVSTQHGAGPHSVGGWQPTGAEIREEATSPQ